MAYDIYVFRGENWWEGSNEPITPDELLKIDRVLKADNVSSTNPQTGMTVKITSNDMFTYNGVYVMLKKGILKFSAGNDESIETIRPLANALNAVIQGDEGEYY